MSEDFSVKKMVTKLAPVLNQAVDLATDISSKTIGVMVNQFDDYSIPMLPKQYESYPRTLQQLNDAVQEDPLDANHHFKLARMLHQNFELTVARIEYEAANSLSPLKGEHRFYYLALLDAMGLATTDMLDEMRSLPLDDSIKSAYPEYYL